MRKAADRRVTYCIYKCTSDANDPRTAPKSARKKIREIRVGFTLLVLAVPGCLGMMRIVLAWDVEEGSRNVDVVDER